MKIKLRDLMMCCAVLFLGFIAYSNFNTLAKQWTSTNCYKNIQYKLVQDGKKGKRYRWKLQFKNNYHQLVTFNYGITEEENDFLTNKRKTLQAHQNSEPVEIYTETKQFYVLVDQLSFEVSGLPIEPCDGE